MIKEGRSELINEYTRAVRYEGNVRSIRVMNMVFEREDWEWRGLGSVANSGGAINREFQDHDALKVFENIFEDFQPESDEIKKKCRCGEVLRGLILPDECHLFMKACNPRDPVGPCMVSFEGICNIWARNR